MPKARRRKNTSFETDVTRSVFLYGRPNKGKLSLLTKMQEDFCSLVNVDILLLSERTDITLQLIKNDKKDSFLRSMEKTMRPKGLSSAFCQNAFDTAVTHLSNRMDDIRTDMMRRDHGIFVLSKVLFAMSVDGKSRTDMISAMEELNRGLKKENRFYTDCAGELTAMSDETFSSLMKEFMDDYICTSMEYKIPHLKRTQIPLDFRLMTIEKSNDIKSPYVISITNPYKKNDRFCVPLDTSVHSLHKITSHDMAGTVMASVRNGKLRIGWSYTKKMSQPATDKVIGVDVGITDAFHTSEDRAVGSMKPAIGFYKDTVEPSFAGLSDLRNKKKCILTYLHRHPGLPKDVRCSLIRKADRLEHMIRTADAPYRKKRHYYGMLTEEIASSVKEYTKTLSHDTLTVLEKLDIKEFEKSRKLNGEFSLFARGQLQKKLMEELNKKGYDFLEVEPAYTSQVCPVCSNLDSNNRDGKSFKCTCCGYGADADYVGSRNIAARAGDKEILKACEEHKYSAKNLQQALRDIYADRNKTYRDKQNLQENTGKASAKAEAIPA